MGVLDHYAPGVCRKVDLSKQASAALMGHDPSSNDSMRDWYDNPPVEELLDEQAARLPNGPLGFLDPPVMEIVEGMTSDEKTLWAKWKACQIGALEFAQALEKLQRTNPQKAVMSLATEL